LIATGRQHQQPQSAPVPENPTQLKEIYHFLRYPTYRRELLIKNLLDKNTALYKLGAFAKAVRFTSGSLLISTPLRNGLENITQRLSAESYIDWASFNDTEPDGTV